MEFSKKASFTDAFYDNYDLHEQLWTGSRSRIYKGVNKKTREPIAVRLLKRESYESLKDAKEKLIPTLNLLYGLTHANIAKTHDIYMDKEYFYIVTEFIEGKPIFDYIKSLPVITEKIVAGFMKELLSAIAYAHKNLIAHGNLSFFNIIITKIEGSVPILKLVNFAGNQILMDNIKPTIQSVVLYSPEKACGKDTSLFMNDIWACGIICSCLLTGLIPFSVKEYVEDTLEEIKKLEITPEKFKEGAWKKVSEEAKQFLMKMLQKNPKNRSLASDLIYEKWITNAADTQNISDELKGFCGKIQKLKSVTSLQNTFLYYMSEKAKSSVLQGKAGALFKEMDKTGSGKITLHDLVTAFNKLGIANKNECEEIFKKMDVSGDGVLNYTEIISAFFGKSLTKSEENLKIAFNMLDANKSGDLDSSEIINALCGNDKTGELAKKIQAELNSYKGKKIKYEDFANLMKKIE